MKSNKRLLVSLIFGLLCVNGVSFATLSPVASHNDAKVDESVTSTSNEETSSVSSDTVDEAEKNNNKESNLSNDFVKIRLLNSNKPDLLDSCCKSCCQNVYNLNYIPSPEVERAMLNFVNESADFMADARKEVFSKFCGDWHVRKCAALSSVNQSQISSGATTFSGADSAISFPSVELKISDELTKPVLYHTHPYDKLSRIAKEYLGDLSEVNIIKSMAENVDVISKMVKEDKLPGDEYLYIPQPSQDKNWLLCKVDEKDTFYSLARKFYGSWECARLLAEFNGRSYLSDRIYDKVIKLPKTLNFSNYVVSSDDSTLSCLCDKLLGSSTYAGMVADLNGLDVNKPLKVGTFIRVPSFSENDLVKETKK